MVVLNAKAMFSYVSNHNVFYLFDAHFTQFQLMYITGSDTIANMNNDIKTSNENTNRHRIAIKQWMQCYQHNVMFYRIASNYQLVN